MADTPQHFDARYAISVKGVLFRASSVLMLLNERDEFELPGGRLEPSESVEEALIREMREETGLISTIDGYVSSGLFEVIPGKHVFVIAFKCTGGQGVVQLSAEHRDAHWIEWKDLGNSKIPDFYRRIVRLARSSDRPVET